MSDIAIHVENLSKQFRIGAIKNNRNFREALLDGFKAPFQRVGRVLRGQAAGAAELDETIWALKDVSFEIKQGEVVGIIGRNGSGKSTLLKILSRITEPTTGFVQIRGRIGSLLEVGTGFHPELTGRENIYLNGAILGMRKEEIRRKFDEIVAFSEIEKFIDTPVKHYSSGMYLRLAFAVAAHLEPEILLVDEVLAVGDLAFQNKCLGKMDEVANQGRTILFVSHSMSAIENLCGRGIVLESGAIARSSSADDCIKYYLEKFFKEDKIPLGERSIRTGTGKIRLTEVFFEMDGRRSPLVQTGKPCNVCFKYRADKEENNVSVSFAIRDQRAQFLFRPASEDTQENFPRVPREGIFRCKIRRLPLVPGLYRINTTIAINGEDADYVQGAGFMVVEGGDFFGTGRLNAHFPVLLEHNWVVQSVNVERS